HHEAALSNIVSIFIGGGTPSILDETDLRNLFATLNEVGLSEVQDITIEANPSDVTPEFARLLETLGVSRVSLGAQSFNEGHLEFLKRTHKPVDIERAVANLKDAGIDNINLDLLFAIPYQTLEDLNRDIDRALHLNLKHISYYSVIIEEDTALSLWIDKGLVEPVSENLEASMYETVIKRLKEAGFNHYEISNFARPGFESLHNSMVWKSHDYLGVGTGAHSKWRGQRFYNVRSIKKYNERIENENSPVMDQYPYEPMKDYLLMGLRLMKGVDMDAFERRFGVPLLEAFEVLRTPLENGLLEIENGHIRFTQRGLFLGNEVFMKL
ncbi:MAG: radical SAM family heme chaperone HemW, partial [Bacillota bacterium]